MSSSGTFSIRFPSWRSKCLQSTFKQMDSFSGHISSESRSRHGASSFYDK